MKQEDGRINWIIRHMMIITGIALLVLLAVKGMEETGWDFQGQKLKGLIKSQAEVGLACIWRQNYPAAAWEEDVREGGNGKRETGGGQFLSGIICQLVFGRSPVVRFFSGQEQGENGYEEADPAFSGYLASGKFYEEHQYLLYDGGEESGLAELEPETAADPAEAEVKTAAPEQDSKTCAVSTVLPVIGTTYRKEQLADFDFLMKHFYSVHTSATAGRDLIKADKFLAEDFTLEGKNDKPQILIYHTHSQETFADYGPDNQDATVVGMGSYLTELLEKKGYDVIHDTSVYDLKNGKLDRNKAYTYSLEGVTRILQENPSVEVVLDLHRDGVDESLHMVNEINGKPTAPIMFFNGVSQTPDGPIEYLPNPYREDNLAFSFQMQLDAAAYFPGLTRKIYIKGLRYNLHLRARSALIEVGAQTNTYQEARNAMEPLAEVLDMVLQGN